MAGGSRPSAAGRSPAAARSNARSSPDAKRRRHVRHLPGPDRGRARLRDHARIPGALTVPRWLKDNGLSIGFGAIFLASLVGQAISGHTSLNHEAHLHHGDPISLWHYVTSAVFWTDVMENWQSEYLQFTLYILATVWLLQKGSNESKPMDDVGVESDEQQLLGEHTKRMSPGWARAGGLRTSVYSNSLVLVMGSIWLLSWFAQSVTGRINFNAEQLDHQAPPVSWA